MTRKLNSPEGCPPVLKEKWEAAGKDQKKKHQAFDVFIACGGNIGKMEAVEEVIRTEIEKKVEEL